MSNQPYKCIKCSWIEFQQNNFTNRDIKYLTLLNKKIKIFKNNGRTLKNIFNAPLNSRKNLNGEFKKYNDISEIYIKLNKNNEKDKYIIENILPCIFLYNDKYELISLEL